MGIPSEIVGRHKFQLLSTSLGPRTFRVSCARVRFEPRLLCGKAQASDESGGEVRIRSGASGIG